jgi:hypothetical protein
MKLRFSYVGLEIETTQSITTTFIDKVNPPDDERTFNIKLGLYKNSQYHLPLKGSKPKLNNFLSMELE